MLRVLHARQACGKDLDRGKVPKGDAMDITANLLLYPMLEQSCHKLSSQMATACTSSHVLQEVLRKARSCADATLEISAASAVCMVSATVVV